MRKHFLALAGRLAVSILMLLPLADAAQAQSVLVSNIEQTGDSELSIHNIRAAQSFTTGSHSLGYGLSSIELELRSIGDERTVTVELRSGSRSGTVVVTLSGTVSGDTPANISFTPSSAISLDPGATYWVIASANHRVNWTFAPSDDEDSGSQSDWRIGDNSFARQGNNSWSSLGRPFLLRINGTVTPDATAPTVTSITRQSPSDSLTNADAVTWRVTFSEDVDSVGVADFSLSGTDAPLTVAVVSGDSSKYDVTASGGNLSSLNGTVTLSFAEGHDIEDKAENALTNTAPTGDNHNTYAIDNTAPTVTSIARQTPSSSPTNADAVTWRVTFSENVQNVGGADFSLSGTDATLAVSPAPGSSSQYDATASGGNLADLNETVTLSFATNQDIEDEAGNALTNAIPTGDNHNTWVIDNTAPTVTISGVPSASSEAFTVTFTFSEGVTGFALEDITLSNATASAFTGAAGGLVYAALIAPTADGQVTIDVAEGAAEDSAGNGNAAAQQAASAYTGPDVTAPTVTSITRQTPSSSPTNADAVVWRVTFSEDVQNVDPADFDVDGTDATLGVAVVSGDSSKYDVTASGGNLVTLNATVTLSFANGHDIEDKAENDLASTTPTSTNHNTWLIDNTAPTVTISGVPSTSSSAFTVTFDFSEGVTGFTQDDITVGNGTASAFTGASGDLLYTARIAPVASGQVTIDVAEDAAEDSAGNGNAAAQQATSNATIAGSVALSADTDEISEANTGTTVTITATLNNVRPSETAVTISVTSGAATSGTDFEEVDDFTIAIPANTLSQTGAFTLTPVQDTVDEPDETIAVTGSATDFSVSGADITLVDDDASPTVTLALSEASIGENGGVSTVTASLNHPSSEPTTVTISVEPASPATDGDYALSANRVLAIAAGAMSSTGEVTVTGVDNGLDEPDKTVTVQGEAVNGLGILDPADAELTIEDDDDVTGVEESEELPSKISLYQNYPNPFNPQTTIRYALPQAGDLRLVVYDMLGHEVAVLIDGPRAAGVHTVHFDAGRLPNGAYAYRLTAGDKTLLRTMILVK